MDRINVNDKTYKKCEYCNKNLNELGMNDYIRACKIRQYKTHINFNKSFKSTEINNLIEILLVGGIRQIDGINIEKNLEKGWSKTKNGGKKL
jgi:hypothetical protein